MSAVESFPVEERSHESYGEDDRECSPEEARKSLHTAQRI
jgi:hypothetical protein